MLLFSSSFIFFFLLFSPPFLLFPHIQAFPTTISHHYHYHSHRFTKSTRLSPTNGEENQILVEPPPSPPTFSRTLSETELISLQQIKQAMESNPYPLTEVTMLRFLRGQKQDVSNTITELITHVTWRQEMNVDALRLDTSSFAQEYQSRKCINEGYDRQGRPLVSMIARRHDKNQRQLEEVCKLIIHTLDTALYRSRERLNDEKIVILFDMSEFSTSALDYEAVKLLINILLKNYPDILAASYIMNAPMLFTACWAIIRPWLDPITAKKCVFIKPNELLEHVDLSEIPSDIVGIPK